MSTVPLACLEALETAGEVFEFGSASFGPFRDHEDAEDVLDSLQHRGLRFTGAQDECLAAAGIAGESPDPASMKPTQAPRYIRAWAAMRFFLPVPPLDVGERAAACDLANAMQD